MKGFHRLPSALCARRDISANAKLGYAYLHSRSRLGLSWPTLAEVESDLGVTRKTAVRLLRELSDSGLASRRGNDIALPAGGETPPSRGGEGTPVVGGETPLPPVEILPDIGGETPPPSVEKLHSVPFYTEKLQRSEREQSARASDVTGLLLFEHVVREATDVGPDLGALREWWRRLRDEWVTKAGKPAADLDAEIREFGRWLGSQPASKRARVVPHLRFRDHLGQWSRMRAGTSIARNARPHTEFVGDDVDEVFSEVSDG